MLANNAVIGERTWEQKSNVHYDLTKHSPKRPPNLIPTLRDQSFSPVSSSLSQDKPDFLQKRITRKRPLAAPYEIGKPETLTPNLTIAQT